MSQFAPFTYDVPCTQCPLRVCEAFRTISEDELDFIAKLKAGELRTGPATTVLREGSPCEQLFTLLEGWAFRYKTLEDGRRQITSFVLPGDLVGIQSSMQAEMDHSVDTLTAAVLCTFPRERVWELYKGCPSLAFDVTWLAATQEMILNENLLSIGTCRAWHFPQAPNSQYAGHYPVDSAAAIASSPSRCAGRPTTHSTCESSWNGFKSRVDDPSPRMAAARIFAARA